MSVDMLLRCPVGPQRLLAIVRAKGEIAKITSDNLIEFACKDCAWHMRKENPDVRRVFHRFNIIGQLVESEILYAKDLDISDNMEVEESI